MSVDEIFQQAHSAHVAGKFADAVPLYERVLSIQPDFVVATYNLALALQSLGKIDQAISRYEQALKINPGYVDALCNLGILIRNQGDLERAIGYWERAVKINPSFALAHGNLGSANREKGNLDRAIAHYQSALKVVPNSPMALCNLGMALQDAGRGKEAVSCFERAVAIDPRFAEGYCQLGGALLELGRTTQAFKAVAHSLELGASIASMRLFCLCLKQVQFDTFSQQELGAIYSLCIKALHECWVRPGEIAMSCVRLLKRDNCLKALIEKSDAAWPNVAELDFDATSWRDLSTNRLLLQLLKSTVVPDLSFERFLTSARQAMLANVEQGATDAVSALEVFCAIAYQCFLNEYVFELAPGELARAQAICNAMFERIDDGQPVSGLQLAVVAAYFPLYALSDADRLDQVDWPEPARELLKQQLKQPTVEMQLRPGIRSLTSGTDETSRRVREQYEENPYPRWSGAARQLDWPSTEAFLHNQFPLTSFRGRKSAEVEDILIAGCGTGQQSLELALSFPKSKILAIDLSLTSLSYAIRKTKEHGANNVEYAQADILELHQIGRTFDVIESVGVLHHLQDLEAGLQSLVKILRPGGFLRLGLYSELARQDVVAARAFIHENGYGTSIEDIRRCRQDLVAVEQASAWRELLKWRDFFSVSECRDLIFHVQEHRTTLPQIAVLLKNNGLSFLGFQIDARTKNAYKSKFPEDRAMLDLAKWHKFETEQPKTFAGMYQFWVQK